MVGWRSHHDWRNVDNLHHGTPVFKDSAEKYEAGGLPSALLYAMEASVNLILEIGPEAIENRVLSLAADLRRRLTKLGAEFDDEPGAQPSQIVAAHFPGRDVTALARQLADKHVLVAARHGRLRVSPHFYNDEDDCERFEAKVIASLASQP